jgi:hypothetical protein
MADVANLENSLYTPAPAFINGYPYGASGGDAAFFNRLATITNPSVLAEDLADSAAANTENINDVSKNSQLQSREIAKATLANRMYLSMQQAAISLAKEAIDVCKQA